MSKTGFKSLYHVCIIDTECYLNQVDNIISHECYLICCKWCRFDILKGGFYKDYHDFKGENTDFFKQFENDLNSFIGKNYNTYIIGHNILYDYITSKMYYALINLGFTLHMWSDSNPFFQIWKKGKQSVYVNDNLNYFNGKLEKLGNEIGFKKTVYDYNDRSLNNKMKAIKYCRNDVEIVYKLLCYLTVFLKDKFNFIPEKKVCHKEGKTFFPLTISSISFNVWNTLYSHNFVQSRESDVNFEKSSYFGGRSECFMLGVINHCCYIDINSMYPNVMVNESLPYDYYDDDLELTLQNLDEFCAIAKVKIYDVKEIDRVFPMIHNKKLLFPVGSFESIICTGELIYMLENDIKFDLIKIQWYRKNKRVKHYINNLYNDRLNEERDTWKLMIKLMLNSFYGKFGQYIKKYENYGDTDIIGINVINDKYVKSIGNVDWVIGDNELSKNTFIPFASHVTSYARLLLWKYIKIIGLENIYYCDTDSMIFNRLVWDKIKDYSHQTDLGKFKIESKGGELLDDFTIHIKGLKDYVLYVNDKKYIKLKGIPQNDFTKQLDENTYRILKWNKLNYYIRKGRLDRYISEYMIKRLKRDYNKGIVIDGKVLPIKF
jgi:hypothetical protein